MSLARAAMDEAYELVHEAASHGWEGLTHAVQEAYDNLEVGVSSLDSARDAAERGQVGVADIRSVVNADEIADRLAGVIGQADEVRGFLEVAAEAVGEAYVRAHKAEASKLTRMISALVECLDAARQVALDAKDTVEKEHNEAVVGEAEVGAVDQHTRRTDSRAIRQSPPCRCHGQTGCTSCMATS